MMWRFDEMKTTIFRLGVLAGAACLLGLSAFARAATVQAGGNPDGAAAEIERINSIVRAESGAFSEEAFRVPAIKRDPQGRFWAAWQRWEGGRSRLELARFGSGGIETSLLVDGPEGDAVSPDFAFAPDGQPWIIWLDSLPAETKVLVLDTASQQTWRLASEPTSSIAGPKIVCDGGGSLWSLLERHHRGVRRGRLANSARRHMDGAGIRPPPVRRTGDQPRRSPGQRLGTIWLAWSGYDGHDFEVYLTSWTGSGWAAETRLSQRAGPNLFPSVGQDPDGNPLVAWTRPSESGRVVSLVSYRRGSAAPEFSIATQAGPPSPPRIIQGQNGPALCVKSGDAVRTESLTSIQSLGSPSPLSVVSTPRLLGNLEFDEDKYVGFGDSITFGYENYYPFPERGYIPRLESILNTQYGGQRVINEGFGGEGTADGVVRIDRVFIADLARYILILDGTNDIINDLITTDSSDLNLREIQANAWQPELFRRSPRFSRATTRRDFSRFTKQDPVFKHQDTSSGRRPVRAARGYAHRVHQLSRGPGRGALPPLHGSEAPERPGVSGHGRDLVRRNQEFSVPPGQPPHRKARSLPSPPRADQDRAGPDNDERPSRRPPPAHRQSPHVGAVSQNLGSRHDSGIQGLQEEDGGRVGLVPIPGAHRKAAARVLRTGARRPRPIDLRRLDRPPRRHRGAHFGSRPLRFFPLLLQTGQRLLLFSGNLGTIYKLGSALHHAM